MALLLYITCLSLKGHCNRRFNEQGNRKATKQPTVRNTSARTQKTGKRLKFLEILHDRALIAVALIPGFSQKNAVEKTQLRPLPSGRQGQTDEYTAVASQPRCNSIAATALGGVRENQPYFINNICRARLMARFRRRW